MDPAETSSFLRPVPQSKINRGDGGIGIVHLDLSQSQESESQLTRRIARENLSVCRERANLFLIPS